MREDLPGRRSVMTVRDLSQGIFDVVDGPEGDWAINQAVHHELLPDKGGSVEPAGGFSGMGAMGPAMKAVQAAVAGRAEGGKVSAEVRRQLAA